MTSSLFEATICAFEERMALRRKMLKVTGVKLSKRCQSQDAEGKIRDSIINCYECKSGETCVRWLATAADGVEPPEFCPNRDIILGQVLKGTG